jgi:hypothetical protein
MQSELQQKINTLRKQLNEALKTHFEKELLNAENKLRDAFHPYARFVRAEQEKLREFSEQLSVLTKETNAMRQQIELMFSTNKKQ